MECKIKNSVEYGDLRRSSTLSEKRFDAYCDIFLNEHNRLPRLDEIPGSNSSELLKKELKINKFNGTETTRLLEFTGTQNVKEAVININNRFVDSQIEAVDLDDEVILNIEQRPTDLFKRIEEIHTPSDNVSSMFILEALDVLRDLYGYDIKEINNDMLESEEWSHLIPSNKTVHAFIYNGDIYINTDNFSPDAKVHEMLHLLVGSIRFTNPELYTSLLQRIGQIPNITELAQMKYPDKTMNDGLEEIFVSEMSKQLLGLNSALNGLSKEEMYEINYHIKRILDTLLFGDLSTKTISDKRLQTMSLKEIAQEVNSSALTNKDQFSKSEVHRRLANKKSELLRNKDLIEQCN